MPSHNQIIATLGAEILKGTHPSGEKLPSEPMLIKRFGVSRTVMREVMKTLSAKGLVESKTRVGTRVRSPVHWNLFDVDVLKWRVSIGLDDEFVRSLTEVRRALEPAAAALAAQRRTVADLAQLWRHIADMGTPGHTRKTFAQADLALHLAIGAASGNALMRSVGGVIEAALLTSFTFSSPVDDLRTQKLAVQGHTAIVEAIQARDADAAMRAMVAVIDAGVRRISAIRNKRRRR